MINCIDNVRYTVVILWLIAGCCQQTICQV